MGEFALSSTSSAPERQLVLHDVGACGLLLKEMRNIMSVT